ncbi:MAG: hypothetical protein ACOYJR_04840 [Acutalibacteraceae bacterium]|jgi:hypothetical protein
MNDIKLWVLGACFAAAACALLELLCPSGKMQKSARTVTAIFFLCAVLLPAGRVLKNLSLNSGESLQTASVPEELSSRVAEQSRSVAQQSVQNLIRSLLGRHGVTPERISVTVETDGAGTIQICGAFIWLNAGDLAKEQQVRTWVAEELGIAVECRSAG